MIRDFFCIKSSFLLPLCFVLAILCGCQNDKEIKNNSDNWEQSIVELNDQYRSYTNSAQNKKNKPMADSDKKDDEAKEDEDQTELKIDWDEVFYWDVYGACKGVKYGKQFGVKGIIIGSSVAGVGLSLAAYIAQHRENAVLYWDGDVSTGKPDFTTNGLGDIDPRDPTIIWDLSQQPMNMAIGVNIGLIHNVAINKVLDGTYTYDEIADENNLKRTIFQVIKENPIFPESVMQILPEIESRAYNDAEFSLSIDNLDIEEQKSLLSEQIVDITEFLGIAFSLDSALMYEYANRYTMIIDDAYRTGQITEEDAFLVNTAVAVGCYSRMLWRNYLPNPSYDPYRMVYNSTDGEWIFCREEYLPLLVETENISIVGIPHFVHQRLAELYFFNSEQDKYGINLEEFAATQETFSFSEETIYTIIGEGMPSFIDVTDMEKVLTMGIYPIEVVPQTEGEIYSISLR